MAPAINPHPGLDWPTLRLSPPPAEPVRSPESPATPPIPAAKHQEQLRPVVGVGNQVTAWIGHQAWTLLGRTGEEFTWQQYAREDSASTTPLAATWLNS
jgi:hypothetical protein